MKQTAKPMAQSIPVARQSDKLLTVRELAVYLGVHEKTIYEWCARRQVPCVRIGNRLRFDPSDILRWVSARKEG